MLEKKEVSRLSIIYVIEDHIRDFCMPGILLIVIMSYLLAQLNIFFDLISFFLHAHLVLITTFWHFLELLMLHLFSIISANNSAIDFEKSKLLGHSVHKRLRDIPLQCYRAQPNKFSIMESVLRCKYLCGKSLRLFHASLFSFSWYRTTSNRKPSCYAHCKTHTVLLLLKFESG